MRIIVVEDQNLVLDSIVHLLSGEPDFEVVKALTDAALADAACEALRPDLVLMDVCTENGSNGLAAAARLRKTFPDIKVVIMTGLPDLSFIDDAKKAGVFSFVYKNLNARDLIAVLRQAEKITAPGQQSPRCPFSVTTS
jgi:DNA-binding NarL/FixJ family response regulator